MFTPYEYTWVGTGKGLLQIGTFVVAFLSVCLAVRATYPDMVAYPREFEGGLEKELGGRGALRVSLLLALVGTILFHPHRSTLPTPEILILFFLMQARAPGDPDP